MRLRSLDVFRGLTVAATVIVNNPGDWGTVYWPLLHAEWHGWTPTDLIFPFFLFIVGVSLALSSKAATAAVVVRRGAVIWGLGLFLAGFPFFNLATIRIPGVLARIAWCYMAAALLARAVANRGDRRRLILMAALALLAGYWLVLGMVPFPGGAAGDLTPAGNIGAWLDRAVLGRHIWRGGSFDPEGLLSTIPAMGTTLFGVLAGWLIKDAPSPRATVRGLLVWGLAGVVAGLAVSIWLPINKSLWTSSYALFTAGLAAASLAVCYWAIDARGGQHLRTATEPFVALGRNAILLFVLSGLVAKTLIYVTWPDPSTSVGGWIYANAFQPLAPPHVASLLFAVAHLLLLYVLLAHLHRKQIYLTV
ncbi:MAG: acyltransferase family protein [Vicinamibacterales bacterium]